MTDFQSFNATSHPIVKLVDDWNNLLHHGLEKPATYIIRKNGSYYEAIKGGTTSGAGTIAYGGADNAGAVDGTDLSAVLVAAWGAMPAEGGLIFVKGGIYTLGTATTFTANQGQCFGLVGEGSGATVFEWEGAGYAFTLDRNVAGKAGWYYSTLIGGFTINGVSKTGGRSGLKIDEIGRIVSVEDLHITQMDIGLYIYNTNTVFTNKLKCVTCNTGVLGEEGITSTLSSLHMTNSYIIDCTNYGVDLQVGAAASINGGTIAICDILVRMVRGANMNFRNIHFETATTYDCYIGTDVGSPLRACEFDNCYFNSSIATAIRADYVQNLLFTAPRSVNHTTFLNLGISTPNREVTLINPQVEDTYLLSGAVSGIYLGRSFGTIIEPRRIGFIYFNDSGDALAEGDVIKYSSNGAISTTAVANDDAPGVIMYGQADQEPVVVCAKGVTPVTVTGATAVRDTLVTQNVVKQPLINNAQTDPKKIIGYVVGTTAGAGTAYVRVL